MKEERFIRYEQPNGAIGFLALACFAYFWVSEDKTWGVLKTKFSEGLVVKNVPEVQSQLEEMCVTPEAQWPDEINNIP